jgi:predicted MFS family arabinose efflux permease
MVGTGFGFALVTEFWPLLIIAFVGTLNPSSGDVSVFLPLEHAVLSRVVDDQARTAVFARYSLVGSLVAGLGSLAAALPAVSAGITGLSTKGSMQAMFAFYAMLGVLAAVAYRGLPKSLESEGQQVQASLHKSKKIVYTLAALFSLDAFGGGLVVQSMVALWLYQRFGMSLVTVGTIFFWTGLLTALSYLVAVRIAKRIGLVNTMVFTHLPANLCLVLIPFMPEVGYVMVLLFIRSALSQMDVPTRSSYVMAVVSPDERPAAASMTSVPRSMASAFSPLLSGYLLGLSSFGWPLIAAGTIKIIYDLLLLTMFRKVKPPEEGEPAQSALAEKPPGTSASST